MEWLVILMNPLWVITLEFRGSSISSHRSLQCWTYSTFHKNSLFTLGSTKVNPHPPPPPPLPFPPSPHTPPPSKARTFKTLHTWHMFWHNDTMFWHCNISLAISLPRVINQLFPAASGKISHQTVLENLAFHSSLRWKIAILLLYCVCHLYNFFKRLGVKGLRKGTLQQNVCCVHELFSICSVEQAHVHPTYSCIMGCMIWQWWYV